MLAVNESGFSKTAKIKIHVAKSVARAPKKTLQLGIEYYPAPPFPERRPQDVAVEIQNRIRRFESEGGKKQLAQEPAFKDMFELSKGS